MPYKDKNGLFPRLPILGISIDKIVNVYKSLQKLTCSQPAKVAKIKSPHWPFIILSSEFSPVDSEKSLLYSYKLPVLICLNCCWVLTKEKQLQTFPHVNIFATSYHKVTMLIQWMATFDQQLPVLAFKRVSLHGFLLFSLRSDFNFKYWKLCMGYQCPFSLILNTKYREMAEIFIQI